MTTSHHTPFLSEIAGGSPIPVGKLAYFQERTRNNLYNFILTKFLEKERAGQLTRAQLARRLGRSPEVITRLLGAPGNWTIATISDLLLGIAAEEMQPASRSVLQKPDASASGLGDLGDVKTGLVPTLRAERVLDLRERPPTATREVAKTNLIRFDQAA